MQFAILFILAFLVGLTIYRLSRQWVWAVAAPMTAFAVYTWVYATDLRSLTFWLVFGLTIVFFASLLGAYVVELRQIEDEQPEDESARNDADLN